VIKTVRERFAPGAEPLTKRDAVAPSLAGALTLGADNLNLGPAQVAMPLYVPPPALVAAAAAAPMTSFQRSLLYAAAALPPRPLVLPHLALMRTGVRPPVEPLPIATPGEARPYIKTKVNAFLGRLEAE